MRPWVDFRYAPQMRPFSISEFMKRDGHGALVSPRIPGPDACRTHIRTSWQRNREWRWWRAGQCANETFHVVFHGVAIIFSCPCPKYLFHWHSLRLPKHSFAKCHPLTRDSFNIRWEKVNWKICHMQITRLTPRKPECPDYIARSRAIICLHNPFGRASPAISADPGAQPSMSRHKQAVLVRPPSAPAAHPWPRLIQTISFDFHPECYSWRRLKGFLSFLNCSHYWINFGAVEAVIRHSQINFTLWKDCGESGGLLCLRIL